MGDNVRVALTWTEDNPGWVATATMTTHRDAEGGAVAMTDHRAVSSVVKVNPLLPLIDVLDIICRDANVHPARLGEVAVYIDPDDLYDVRSRMS